MASLALGVAGAFAGSAFGPLGASIGWTLGAALGNALFPQKIQGPRLQDLRLQTSSYGKMNPLLWGTMRVAGNVIWIGNGGLLVEHEETSGGKGGPETTNYTYSASFAIRLVDVEIAGIDRIWWNGRLVSTEDVRGDLPLTIYLGTETQLPDPTMEADLGVGNVPAYRGVAYVVLTDMFLTDGGNAIGNWEFECYTAAGDIPIRISTWDAQSFPGSGTPMGVVANADGTLTQYVYKSDTSYVFTTYQQDGTVVGSPVTGSLGGGIRYGTVLNMNCCVVDPFNAGATFYVNGQAGHRLLGGWPTPAGVTGVRIGDVVYFPSSSSGDGIVGYPIVRDPGNDRALDQPQAVPIGYITLPGTSSGNLHIGHSTDGYVYVWDSGSGDMYQIEPDLTAVVKHWLASDFPSDGGFYRGGFVRYNDFFAQNYDFPVSQFRLNLISIAASGLTNYPQPRGPGGSPDFVFAGGQIAPLGGGYYLGKDGVVLLKPPKQGVPLSVIVADISGRCGLDENEIDVNELTDIVDGFLVDQQATGRDMIQPTRDAYFYDGSEIDDKVVFVKRKADSLVTIPADDLAAHVDGETPPPVVGLARTQEVDLPAMVTVNYVNAAADYQAGAQTSQRQVTQSQSAIQLTFPISLSDAKAKSVADTHVLLPWVERNRFSVSVSRKYAQYTPTDVITADGHKFRIIDKNETRPGVIKLDGVAALAPVLIQAGIPVSNPIFTSVPETPSVAAATATLLYLFDLPLANDEDEQNGIYAAMAPDGEGSWSGAALFRSDDGGTTYTEIANTTAANVMGTASSGALGNFLGGDVFDEANSVTVITTGGELTSATELAVLNGANLAVIGSELIQFKNATLTAEDTYVLTGLLRGRRGTEWAIGGHGAGERFALFPLLRVASPFGLLDLTRQYKAVTFGATLASATAQDFADRGESLAPYSPVLLGGGCDAAGDVTINWIERTRIGGAWHDFADIPLVEDTLAFVLQIWNSSYTLCARIFEGIAPPYSYLASEQVTDFGAQQQTIFFTVGQLGAHGLGHQTRGTAVGAGSTNDDPLAPIAPYGSPGSAGGSPPVLAAIAMPMLWRYAPNRAYSASFGTFDCSHRLEVTFTTDSPTAPDVLGSISAVAYPSGSNQRVACLSSVAGDFSGTDLGAGSVVISANPVIQFSVGSNSFGLPELAASTTYYLNVKNDNGFGACTCRTGDCGMYVDLVVPAGTVSPVVTWDVAYVGTGVTLSNGNLTALGSNVGTQLVRATTSKSSGKCYFEIACDNAENINSHPQIGVADSTLALSASPGLGAGDWAFWADARTVHNASAQYPSGTSVMADADVVMVAVDFSAGKIWFGKNGTWLASGNPAAGSNALYSDITGTLYPVVRVAGVTGVQVTGRFKTADFSYSAPSGFSSWE